MGLIDIGPIAGDPIVGHPAVAGRPFRLTGVEVEVEVGEVAAGDIDPQAVAGGKAVGGGKQVQAQLVYPARLQ